MDFKTQSNTSQQPQPSTAPVARPVGDQPPSGGRKVIGLVIGLVVVLALVVAGLMLWQAKGGESDGGLSAVEEDKYQALFLTNGQVYFGNLESAGEEYVELSDVYYLQVQQDVQPAAETKATDQPQVSLTKLGNELHGPTDKMHVSKEQVLFWENLKDDSTVVKAIKDYKSKQQ